LRVGAKRERERERERERKSGEKKKKKEEEKAIATWADPCVLLRARSCVIKRSLVAKNRADLQGKCSRSGMKSG
jgi:hypothetical protein